MGALIAAYAANIEQSFDLKLALWAMYEVAAADGIDDGEMVVIHAFAEKWGIDFDENQRWMQRIVFPLISDDIDYRGEDSSARGDLLDSARELDKELASGGDGGDFFTTLLTEFGVDSIEDLVNELTDGEDDDHTVPAQSIDEWPAIWKAYSEDEWDGVLNAIKSGVDVNETADIGGVGGLPIITIEVAGRKSRSCYRPDLGRPDEGRLGRGRPERRNLDRGNPALRKTDRRRPEQCRPELDKLSRGRPEQGKTDLCKTDRGRPDRGKLGRGRPEQGKTDGG